PLRAVATDDIRNPLGQLISVGYYQRGWQGDITQNAPEFAESYMLPPSTQLGPGGGAEDWQDAPHTHDADVRSGGPTSTGDMVPAATAVPHSHTFTGTPDPAGSTG